MLRIQKQDIMQLPVEAWSTYTLEELEQALQADPLTPFESWLLPQLVAWYGSWRILECGKQTVIHNCDTPLKRVLYSLSRIPRSQLVKVQTKLPQYSVFVPLVACGLKRMQGVSYEFWRGYQGREWILEPRLLEAVDVACPDLGSTRLLELRSEGLKIRSGPKQGQSRPPESTWSLSGLAGTELGGLPKLTQTMLTQCWVAHPKHRTHEMILDPHDWDRMPPPLATAEIFTVEEQKPIETKQKVKQALPWD